MRITICGGGNLGHVCAGYLASQTDNHVSLLTSRPEVWSDQVVVRDSEGRVFPGLLEHISARAADVIPGADIVLVCLPGFAIPKMLESIKDHLDPATWVGSVVSSTGFFFEAMKTLPASQPLFGFQRVPFIARVVEYGKSADLKGYKDLLKVAVEQTSDKESVRQALQRLFGTPVALLGSHYAVSLSNSNPLLHPSRLYTMWKDWVPGMTYPTQPLFYEGWTEEAAQLLIDMDEEFQRLLRRIGLAKDDIAPILDYYESTDALSLARKLRSIEAFKRILSPMRETADGRFAPDLGSRYFTEDFPYGMRFIVETAHAYAVAVPTIENVYQWGIGLIGETTHL